DLRDNETIPTPLMAACPPIGPDEIQRRITRIKNDSAAGPDCIKKCHLRKSGVPEILAKLFNILLILRYYPTSWKCNRTTLIPKPGKDLSKAENWRPITIGSMVARIFSGIIDNRLRKHIVQSSRQKGFTNENGCKDNSVLLDRTIAQMKTEGGGIITIVDISKAFDTVPHSVIQKSLTRKGAPVLIAKYIRAMYEGCKTKIKTRNNDGPTVELRRGVKQGDPLSPLLFNLAIEPIIETLNSTTAGLRINESNLSVLAFADDMVLIARNKIEAEKQVHLLGSYLGGLGMTLAVTKCRAFEVVAKSKSWYIKNPKIVISNEEIPGCKPDESMTYLGAKLNPWVGLRKGADIPSIVSSVKNVGKM
ncbi:hypothetical protein KM043_018869, partial [Ampulex compressa]